MSHGSSVCCKRLFSANSLYLLPNGMKLTNQVANSIGHKPSVTHPVKNFLPFMKPKGSLLCSQKHSSGPYADPDETILFP
jgi:hypothetical protein